MMKRCIAVLVLASAASCAHMHKQDAASLVGLTPPVDVFMVGGCPDGGSTKGTLVDAEGKEYHFFVDRGLQTKTYGRWYVGADINTGNAVMIPKGDGREEAIRQLCVAWVDREYTRAEQTRLLELETLRRKPYGGDPEYHKWRKQLKETVRHLPPREKAAARLKPHAAIYVLSHYKKNKEPTTASTPTNQPALRTD